LKTFWKSEEFFQKKTFQKEDFSGGRLSEDFSQVEDFSEDVEGDEPDTKKLNKTTPRSLIGQITNYF